MGKYKFIGTKQDLIDNNFDIIDNMVIKRARRSALTIYYESDKENMLDENTFIADSHFRQKEIGHKLEKNILYCVYKEKEETNLKVFQDLVDKGLVVEDKKILKEDE